jgi:hypothetical protein
MGGSGDVLRKRGPARLIEKGLHDGRQPRDLFFDRAQPRGERRAGRRVLRHHLHVAGDEVERRPHLVGDRRRRPAGGGEALGAGEIPACREEPLRPVHQAPVPRIERLGGAADLFPQHSVEAFEAGQHGVEVAGERADLVVAVDVRAGLQIAGGHASHGLLNGLERAIDEEPAEKEDGGRDRHDGQDRRRERARFDLPPHSLQAIHRPGRDDGAVGRPVALQWNGDHSRLASVGRRGDQLAASGGQRGQAQRGGRRHEVGVGLQAVAPVDQPRDRERPQLRHRLDELKAMFFELGRGRQAAPLREVGGDAERHGVARLAHLLFHRPHRDAQLQKRGRAHDRPRCEGDERDEPGAQRFQLGRFDETGQSTPGGHAESGSIG